MENEAKRQKIMNSKAKKLEKKIRKWQDLITETSIWLFLATLGCYGIPIKQWYLLLLAICTIVVIFYSKIMKTLSKRVQPFQDDLSALKGKISEEDYENINIMLSNRGILKNRLPGLLSFLFSILSFFFVFFLLVLLCYLSSIICTV